MTAAAISAAFADIQMIKSRNVMVFKFEVPLEQADAALTALGGVPLPGQEKWVAIARMESPKHPQTVSDYISAHKRYEHASEGEKAVIRAGALARDPEFQSWLSRARNRPDCDEERAAEYIRWYCGIDSRAELAANTTARARFEEIETSFRYEDQQTSAHPPAPERPST